MHGPKRLALAVMSFLVSSGIVPLRGLGHLGAVVLGSRMVLSLLVVMFFCASATRGSVTLAEGFVGAQIRALLALTSKLTELRAFEVEVW